MNNYCIYIRNRKGNPYCKLLNKEITFSCCRECVNKEYKTKNKENSFYKSNGTKKSKNSFYKLNSNQIKKKSTLKEKSPLRSGNIKSKRSKATDIDQKVKLKVWERDKHCCVICGNNVNVMPNAHYISRAKGGLGIEENIFTACTRLTENDCHYRFDNGTKEEKELLKEKVKNYLSSIYPNWNEDNLYYKKGGV
ncbi:MAG: hypothetical protein MR598_03450 [Erysipelotrichaceae bacterium]|nr:hypothetical protein [Erysipelotrichaceae bacterium]